MNRIACILTFLLPVVARAETKSFDVTVTGAKDDRANVPVTVTLPAEAVPTDARSVVLKGPDGKAFPGQVTHPGLLARGTGASARELHFVLPKLSAGETMKLTAAVSTNPPEPGESFAWHDRKGEYTDLRFGTRPVLRYMYRAYDDSTKEARELTYKVYHHLFDPTGQRLVTKGPGGLYPHHRGLFYGFNRITYGNGVKADTWHCPGNVHQAHQGFLASEAGPVLGRHRVAVGWHGPDKQIFAREERELTVYHVPGGLLVEFASVLRSTAGKVKLDGDPQHAGFQFRADNEVASKTSKQTYYLRPDGPGKPGETRNWEAKKGGPVNLPWNAMSFVLGDKRYTVAYLDKPSNPKEARFSERDYGRFGSYFEYELDEKKPLAINYRVWLQEGEITAADVGEKSAVFVLPIKGIMQE